MAEDDLVFRNRLLAMTLVRLIGLLLALAGLAVFYSDVVQEGGWPQLGAAMIVIGILASTFLPLALRRRWNRDKG